MVTLPIPLPNGFSIVVAAGDTVKTGDVLAKRIKKKDISISIPQIFKIPIKKSAKTLRKNPGESIVPGDILASRKRKLGLFEDVIISQIEGSVLRYERDSGRIILLPKGAMREQEEENETICSPIDGLVELCDNVLSRPDPLRPPRLGEAGSEASKAGKILLKTDQDIIPAASGIGGEVSGEVYVIPESQSEHEGKVQLHFLDSRVIGKIVLGGYFDRDTLLKAVGMGAGGVIAFSIRSEDLDHVQERHVTTPIVSVEKEGYIRLLKWDGKKIFLQGDNKTILLLHL